MTTAWKALTEHHEKIRDLHLRKLFAAVGAAVGALVVAAAGAAAAIVGALVAAGFAAAAGADVAAGRDALRVEGE